MPSKIDKKCYFSCKKTEFYSLKTNKINLYNPSIQKYIILNKMKKKILSKNIYLFSAICISHTYFCVFLPENCVDCITNKYSQSNLIFEYFDIVSPPAAVYYRKRKIFSLL